MKTTTFSKDSAIEQLPLSTFSEKAYLDYSMYVILDRALPHIGDGLKPVQRRIVYAMSELGLSAKAKYKKSARTVGDVLGKYHPHGDSACYEAMVLMAQPFSYRYPLVDGQGNWGSSDDPKAFAAMRYTESRLTAYAQCLLSELDQGTVDWQPNFDGTLQEPALLSARLPNILLNGTTGIAVGMATDIPPHNVREVVAACVRLLEDKDADLDVICEHIQGPDFPTYAEIITPIKDIHQIYKTGHGSVRMRATYTVEAGEIVVNALPYQSAGTKVLEQIAAMMMAKKLPMVSDLRDESDHDNPTRLVITPRSNRVDVDALMSHLFASTDLERSYRVNLNMIGLDGRPHVKPLVTLLKEWLEFRQQVVRRRLEYRLNKVNDRLHILEGLMVAFLNIDEVIAIIRREDKPKHILIKRFSITERQAEAILELKLRQLAKLEEIKIRTEQEELAQERDRLQKVLTSNKKLKTLVRDELLEDAQKYGDERRSQLFEREQAQVIREEEMLPSELITVVLSTQGWIRAAKGHDVEAATLNYKSGDSLQATAKGKTNQWVVLLDSTGRSYSVPAHTLPSARGQGEPLTKQLKPPPGARFISVLMGADDDRYVVASNAGYGFVVRLRDLHTKNRQGKAVVKLTHGSTLLMPQQVMDLESQYLAALTSAGKLLLFPVADLPELARGKGNKIINIPAAALKAHTEVMQDIVLLSEGAGLKVLSDNRAFSLSAKDVVHYQGERAKRGWNLPRGIKGNLKGLRNL